MSAALGEGERGVRVWCGERGDGVAAVPGAARGRVRPHVCALGGRAAFSRVLALLGEARFTRRLVLYSS